MNDQKETDHEQEKRHFQSINAANVTNTVSTLLTLAVGVAAFAVNILVNSQGPLDHCAGKWLVASLGLLLLSAFVGIIIFFIRIEDYKRTIEGIVMQRNHPGEVSLEVARAARSLKKTADVLNASTRILLYLQPVFFMLGFLCLAVSVLIANWAKLF